jgi:two-component system cell cycle response regulator
MQVLIADDSAVSRTMIARLVEAWGYDAVTCPDGDEAWRRLSAPKAPRLAILDWVMPGLEGLEVCRRVRARERGGAEHRTFIYLLTARTRNEDVLAGLDAGVDDYLTKPLNAMELKIRLRNGRRLIELHEELLVARARLHDESVVDPETGLATQKAFREAARRDLERSTRLGRSSGLVLLQGDALDLGAVGERLRSAVRTGDRLAYLGDGHFGVFAPDSDDASVQALAARLAEVVGAARVGVSLHAVGESFDRLLLDAHRALAAAP